MRKSANAALTQSEETTEELVGILTAISVVSKRLAKKLAMLEKPPDEGRDKTDATAETASAHANQSRAI
ncbi:hypothetical protein [Petrotoga olearia]|uniref:Uncharacterized protein n=1 Tax=Petrotoga olearia TaxID=156203 RepID=A0ABX9UEP7_9BACT|nr:hypothetical protein [Petrotoga olearia]RMA75596.1 hypothetical protein C8D75_0603 [Petrotoga olearia]